MVLKLYIFFGIIYALIVFLFGGVPLILSHVRRNKEFFKDMFILLIIMICVAIFYPVLLALGIIILIFFLLNKL